MKRKVKRTLLEDLLQVYYSIKCENIYNDWCISCRYCKNKRICDKAFYLIRSIRNFY